MLINSRLSKLVLILNAELNLVVLLFFSTQVVLLELVDKEPLVVSESNLVDERRQPECANDSHNICLRF